MIIGIFNVRTADADETPMSPSEYSADNNRGFCEIRCPFVDVAV